MTTTRTLRSLPLVPRAILAAALAAAGVLSLASAAKSGKEKEPLRPTEASKEKERKEPARALDTMKLERFLSELGSDDEKTRTRAADQIQELIEALFDAIGGSFEDMGPEKQAFLLEALGGMKDAIEGLQAVALDPPKKFTEAERVALEKELQELAKATGNPEAMKKLRPALDLMPTPHKGDLLASAEQALEKGGGPEAAVRAAPLFLDDPAPDIRARAVALLLAAKDKRTLPLLQARLQDPEHGVRARALMALGATKFPEAIPLIVDALKDGVAGTRITALYALQGFPDDLRAMEGAKKSLSDPDPEVRIAALRALSATRSPLYLDPLVKALEDAEGDVREVADEVLRGISGKKDSEFFAHASPKEREPAISKWKEWLKGPTFAPAAEAGPPVSKEPLPVATKDPSPPPPAPTPEELRAMKAKEKEDRLKAKEERKKAKEDRDKAKDDKRETPQNELAPSPAPAP